jgi:hypothetical protein
VPQRGEEDDVTTTTTTETFEDRIKRESAAKIAEQRAVVAAAVTEAAVVLGKRFDGTFTAHITDKEIEHWPNERLIEGRITHDNTAGGFGVVSFSVRYVAASKRVCVSTELPKDVKWDHVGRGETRPEATYAPDRGAKGLVQSIAKIVNDAHKFVSGAIERKRQNDDYNANANAALERVAAALGVKVAERERESGTNKQTHAYITKKGTEQSVTVDAQVYGDSVTLSIRSLPLDVAEKVLKLIRKEV